MGPVCDCVSARVSLYSCGGSCLTRVFIVCTQTNHTGWLLSTPCCPIVLHVCLKAHVIADMHRLCLCLCAFFACSCASADWTWMKTHGWDNLSLCCTALQWMRACLLVRCLEMRNFTAACTIALSCWFVDVSRPHLVLKNVFIIFQSHREIKHRRDQMLFVGRRLGFFQIQHLKLLHLILWHHQQISHQYSNYL